MGGSSGVFAVPEHGGVLYHFNRLKYTKMLNDFPFKDDKRNNSLVLFTYKLLEYTIGVKLV